jgi:vacuolar-type H+-ATPase subunit F/Vma7
MPEEKPVDKLFAILGDEDVVLGFEALGFKVYITNDQTDFKAVFEQLVKDGVSVCLVQDDVYKKAGEFRNNYKQLALPIFVPFSKDGKPDLLNKIVKDVRLKATGAI